MIERRSKARLKDEARLSEILEIAETQIAENGIKNINMSALINQSSISRATLYTLVENKDTLIAYLAIKGINELLQLSKVAKNYESSGRVKLVLLFIGHSIFIQRKSLLFQCIYVTNTLSSRENINKSLESLFDMKMSTIIREMQWCVELSVLNQEFVLPPRLSSFDIALFLWTASYGMLNMSKNIQLDYNELSIRYKYLLRSLLDSWNWHPLSSELDYDAETQKIIATCYLKEYTELMQMKAKA